MPSLPHRPVLAHRDGTSSFASLHNSDVYYSNDEIAVLYDVVSAAQGNLNHLPEGERLATNALFQAYDTVLPLHGIDPEEDHHISRLVFRVGGERGDGTLMDKLRAVLSRMGIEIEFETHSGSPKPQFFQAYEGAQALPPESFSSLSGVEPVLHVAEGLFQDASKGYLRGHLKLSPPSAAPAHVFQPPSHFRLTDALPATDDPSSALREHRRPLSQIFTHSVAIDYKQRRSDSWSQTENVEQRVVSDATAQPANSAPMGPQSDKGDSISYPKKPKPVRSVNWMLPGTANEPLFDGRGDCLEQHHGRSVQPTRESNVDRERVAACEESPPSLPVKNRPPGEDYSPGQSYVDEESQHQPAVLGNIDSARNSFSRKTQNLPAADPGMESQYALLEIRASKAARYLQLLRGISHWRACAIEKLERTAVARRHILRMRYFDPWELITADAKAKGRRLFMSYLLSLWSEQADDTDFGGRTALAKARQSFLTRLLAAWSQLYSAQRYSKRPRGSVILHLQQWQTACSMLHTLQTRVDVLFRMFAISQLSSVWRKDLRISQEDISSFKQRHLVYRSLVQWHLETKVEVFRARLGSRLVCEALYRWHSACLAPLTLDDYEHRILAGDPTREKLHRLPRAFMSCLTIMHRMLRTKVLEQWQYRTVASANNMKRSSRRADHHSAQIALGTWHDNVQHGLGLSTWAQRGRFYVSATSSLKLWRAKAMWSSNTRKSYAQCRQRVKITLTKGYMFRWKALVSVRADIGRESAEHHGIVTQARLGLMLAAWREESNSNLRVTISLMVALLQEWHSLSVVDASEQQRAANMWDEMLKTRYWGQWQSTLLQLKSREYVASDVKERNEKKLVRRILLAWKGDGREVDSQLSSAMRMSLTTSRRRMSLGANRNSIQLPKAFRERIAPPLRSSGLQEFGLVAEEDGPGSGGDVDRVVVNTPTRWTGMASSVTRLPSMTPFAPLPTPFERELREKYTRSTAAVSQSKPNRLSFAQPQRTSAKEAGKQQVADCRV